MPPEREIFCQSPQNGPRSLKGRARALSLAVVLALLGGSMLLTPALAKPTNRPVTPASPNGPGVRATPASPARVERPVSRNKSSKTMAGMNSGRTDPPKGGVRAGEMGSPSGGRMNAAAFGGVFP